MWAETQVQVAAAGALGRCLLTDRLADRRLHRGPLT